MTAQENVENNGIQQALHFSAGAPIAALHLLQEQNKLAELIKLQSTCLESLLSNKSSRLVSDLAKLDSSQALAMLRQTLTDMIKLHYGLSINAPSEIIDLLRQVADKLTLATIYKGLDILNDLQTKFENKYNLQAQLAYEKLLGELR